MLKIGTSGFSYQDWVGPYYPAGTPKNRMLELYSRDFSTVEVNSTFYALPSLKAVESMIRRSGGRVEFVLKAHQNMTHKFQDVEQHARAMAFLAETFQEHGVFGAILLQFPYSFKNTIESRNFLKKLRGLLPELDLVVEFRNRGWISEDIFSFLTEQQLGFCCVDQPQFRNLVPPIVRATTELGYMRFHGRNAEQWWHHEHPHDRYRYSYSGQELKSWLTKLKRLEENTAKGFIFFNNHPIGHAAINAKMLIELWKGGSS